MSLKLNLYRNTMTTSKGYGMIYGRVENDKPMTIEKLAQHMHDHNSPYETGLIVGILTNMVKCIRELALEGKPVKLDNLCIFSPAVTSLPANDVDSFDLSIRPKGGDSGNITKVRIQCRNTGLSTNENVTRGATGMLGYTSLAQRIKSGEVVLSDKKGEYIATDGGGSGWGDEPVVNP